MISVVLRCAADGDEDHDYYIVVMIEDCEKVAEVRGSVPQAAQTAATVASISNFHSNI